MQDGSHDVISRRKGPPLGEKHKASSGAYNAAAPTTSSWSTA